MCSDNRDYAPSSVPAGEPLIVDVSVENITGADRYLTVTGVYDTTPIPFQFDYLWSLHSRRWYSVLLHHAGKKSGDGIQLVLDESVSDCSG